MVVVVLIQLDLGVATTTTVHERASQLSLERLVYGPEVTLRVLLQRFNEISMAAQIVTNFFLCLFLSIINNNTKMYHHFYK